MSWIDSDFEANTSEAMNTKSLRAAIVDFLLSFCCAAIALPSLFELGNYDHVYLDFRPPFVPLCSSVSASIGAICSRLGS